MPPTTDLLERVRERRMGMGARVSPPIFIAFDDNNVRVVSDESGPLLDKEEFDALIVLLIDIIKVHKIWNRSRAGTAGGDCVSHNRPPLPDHGCVRATSAACP